MTFLCLSDDAIYTLAGAAVGAIFVLGLFFTICYAIKRGVSL